MDFDDILIMIIIAVTISLMGMTLEVYSAQMYSDIVLHMQQLDIIDTTSVLEACLKDGDNYIDIETLDEAHNYGSIKTFCGVKDDYLIASLSGAKIVDLETNKKWVFGAFMDMFAGNSHNVFVSIRDGENIHVGKLYTQAE
jgi:hypothetical protein